MEEILLERRENPEDVNYFANLFGQDECVRLLAEKAAKARRLLDDRKLGDIDALKQAGRLQRVVDKGVRRLRGIDVKPIDQEFTDEQTTTALQKALLSIPKTTKAAGTFKKPLPPRKKPPIPPKPPGLTPGRAVSGQQTPLWTTVRSKGPLEDYASQPGPSGTQMATPRQQLDFDDDSDDWLYDYEGPPVPPPTRPLSPSRSRTRTGKKRSSSRSTSTAFETAKSRRSSSRGSSTSSRAPTTGKRRKRNVFSVAFEHELLKVSKVESKEPSNMENVKLNKLWLMQPVKRLPVTSLNYLRDKKNVTHNVFHD